MLILTYPIIIGLQQPQVSIRHALNSEQALNQHSNTYNSSNTRLFSDLMKFSVENESSPLKQLVCSVIEKKSIGSIIIQQNDRST